MEDRKKHWGDRKDGYLIRDLDAMHYVMPHIYPNRCDNEAYISQRVDLTAINAYLKGLEGDVLDKTADNRCFVSLSGQRSYLEARGTDTSEMKDTDILKANTGSQVFLEAKLTFCDAMEDLALVISM